MIELDVDARRLHVDVADEELAARTQSADSVAAYAAPTRGWAKLYVDHVMQADTGADLDFLVGPAATRSRVSRTERVQSPIVSPVVSTDLSYWNATRTVNSSSSTV